ncbi:MAG: Ig-like domain-containing protein [Lachnospiraceae bacterium]|nr:Ig-like domain-containing protein [Lachnospiraceae bacterium]
MERSKLLRCFAGFMSLIMAAGMLVISTPGQASAQTKTEQILKKTSKIQELTQSNALKKAISGNGFETPTGTTVELKEEDDTIIKGISKSGEKTYTIQLKIKNTSMIGIVPKIRYNQEEIQDKTTFTIEKEGKPVTLYKARSEENPFDESNIRADAIMLSSDKGGWYYTVEQILTPGTYTIKFELPETVTEGARIYIEIEGYELTEGQEQQTNTKDTANVLKLPVDIEKDEFYGGISAGENNEFWYKFTLSASRKVEIGILSIFFGTDKGSVMTLYYPDGTSKSYKGEVYGEKDMDGKTGLISIGMIQFSKKLAKGTYYIQMKPIEDTADGVIGAGFDIPGPSKPTVTYWAQGKKVVKGTAEPNTRAYAIVKGKTYSAKTSQAGKFSIKIPSVKAGTKIQVYVKDATGVSSSKKTVTVRKIPKGPTLTSYKKGTTKIKGKCVYNGTAKVRYNGKTYQAEASKKGYFTIKTAKLVSGKKVYVSVKDISGNVSKTRVYTVK